MVNINTYFNKLFNKNSFAYRFYIGTSQNDPDSWVNKNGLLDED